MRRAFAVVVIIFSLCFGSAAMALGFGPVSNATRLGQPLDFAVGLKLDAGESLSASCVLADVTAGDSRIPPAQVHARLLYGGRAADAQVHITTTGRVREPVVTVVVSVGCPPRITHKFVSLLDPPSGASRSNFKKVAALAPLPVPAIVAEAAPPAAPAIDAQDRQQEREQLQALQERVERLRQEQQGVQQSLGLLQAKLRATEEVRHDPALYGLATLVVLLLGVIAVLLWRQSRQGADAAWLRDAQALAAFEPRPSQARTISSSPVFDEAPTTGGVVDTTYPSLSTEPATAAVDPMPTTIPAAARVRRELTSEELIDLEQQADFFIAIGQEESAIDLLMAHVRSSGGTSPMPYLKLLQIYRRRGEPQSYERIRERFERRFNAQATDWASDPARGRPLEDYPDVVDRLQRVWPVPARAADLLEALLFRRDPAQAGFDLPAYEELLFLYALARDLVETSESPDSVDLLLPLEIGDATPAITRMSHGASRVDPPVDVDLDLGAPGPSPAGG